ncbi:transketolase [Salinisphaera shabanensis T35B1]|jgi:transketolase|uniref:Transketolase n=1 Tax=Salinisphaera shabanensis E1L3A TaxID=1033802 RepID=F7QCE9_9GAMM|nr:transketolase [Salinisphaera shabanensis]ERJ18464.1 Transketolase protein [Salinisphaera shabanensis E1L3A]
MDSSDPLANAVPAATDRDRPDRRTLANAIRILAMDAVQQANSGHPGMPMGMADIAEVLANDFMRCNPSNPGWPDRDRLVVSNGHGCMLQYALLHLTGYDLPLEQLRQFRQLHSRTPGHPEYRLTPGVETTTGPLGQGLANAVGMALAEATLAAEFNRDGENIVDHWTWCLAGDGCLMEGISHEACSLAGHLGLGKLVVFYDDNGISIDGEVAGWFSDDTAQRFEAYGWQVVPDIDGHNAEAIAQAIATAREDRQRPTLICCKTIIGWGAPNKQGTEGVHGAALGDEEIAATRAQIGWADTTPFAIPDNVYAAWDKRAAGAALEGEWQQRYERYAAAHPELAAEFMRRQAGDLPADWSKHMMRHLHHVQTEGSDTATRKSSKAMIEFFAPRLPELFGGSADLSGSNGTDWNGHTAVGKPAYRGNYLHYGVREFGMTAIANGLALHGGYIPFTATFLTFSDYARNAVRMAALMGTRQILVYTHDSIGLGEDGPTHQSVEHLSSLRLIPNLHVWRPADDVETVAAWMAAIERAEGPSALALSRQDLPHLERDVPGVENIRRGGYVLHEPPQTPEALIIATGSEVAIAVATAKTLAAEGRAIRVVSMPCLDLFETQDAAYRESVLPAHIEARVAIEAGVSALWRYYVGPRGRVLGVDRFGESAPAADVYRHFGLTEAHLANALLELIGEPETA